MSNYRINSPTQAAALITAVASFVLALCSTAVSQTGGDLNPASSGEPGVQSTVNRLDMSEREFALRNRQVGGNRLLQESQRKLQYAEIRQDFERIQELNKALVSTIAIQSSPNYKHISNLAMEVKKHATRLKLNLALPKLEGEGKVQNKQDRDDLNESLNKFIVMLDHSIVSLVSNALFKQGPDVINAQHVTKAGRDLNSIIELSEGLRKSAVQWDKSKK